MAALGPNRGRDLQDLLGQVDQHLDEAFVLSRRVESYRITLDSSEEQFDQSAPHWVLVGGTRDGGHHAAAFLGANPIEIAERARDFLDGFPRRTPASALELPALVRFGQAQASALHDRDPAEFRQPVRALFEKAQRRSSSRIVFHGSYLESHATDQIFLSREQHQHIYSLRSRGGVTMAAWTGDDLASGQAQVSGQAGPALVTLSEERIAAAAEDALSQLHARSATSGSQEVLLSPAASALLAYHGFAHGPALTRSEFEGISIVDDPGSGYGGFARDDQGNEAPPQTLVGPGASQSTQRGFLRRDDQARSSRGPANLVLEAGTMQVPSLIAGIDSGVLLHGPLHCSVDPVRGRFSLVCAQAREIHKGRFTGRLFGRQVLRSGREEFLAATQGLGELSETLAFDDEGIPRSSRAPHWLSRAEVEAG